MQKFNDEMLALKQAAKTWFCGLAAVAVLAITLRILGTYRFYLHRISSRDFSGNDRHISGLRSTELAFTCTSSGLQSR